MIEQATSVVLVIQYYFLSLCHFISFHLKKLGSPTKSHRQDRNSSRGEGDKFVYRKTSASDGTHALLKPCSEIPGPRCLPVIGSLLEFNKFGPREVHALSLERHNKYGNIFRERLFTQELIFVEGPEILKQWMSQEGKLPTSLKQEPSIIFSEIYPEFKRGLFFRNGEEWRALRKLGHSMVLKGASDFESEGLFHHCEEFLECSMKTIREATCNGEETGIMTNLEDIAYDTTVGCTFRVVYGKLSSDVFEKYTGTDLRTMARYAKEININCQSLLEVPTRLAKWFSTQAWIEYSTKLHHNLSKCRQYGQELRKEILQNPESASLRSHGLLYKTVTIDAPLEDADDMLSDFAIDSKDPLAATVMFITQVLAACPDIQEKILEEVYAVYANNERISYQKVKCLEYTKSFLKEVLRLYPVAPFTARLTNDETVLGSYKVPAGAMIMYSTYASQRNPKYFSEPLMVAPERWLGRAHGNHQSSVPTCESAAFAPFGLNQRVCLGQNIANSFFLMYTANIVRTFKLATAGMPDVIMRTVLYPANPERPIYLKVR